MGKRGKEECLLAILKRHNLADKKEKWAMLDEFCKVAGTTESMRSGFRAKGRFSPGIVSGYLSDGTKRIGILLYRRPGSDPLPLTVPAVNYCSGQAMINTGKISYPH